MKRTIFYAFIVTDTSRNISFTKHYSHYGAEKHYGDLSRHYKGSSRSDYTLCVYEGKQALIDALGHDYVIDWDKKQLRLKDRTAEPV